MKTHWMQQCAGLMAVGTILTFSNGCSRHGSPIAGGEAPKTAQINVFGERHEIFAEHRLVSVGTATKFVTHVTDLKTLEPRQAGPIRFRLQLGQEAAIEQVEKAPVRAGIYEVMLTFPKAGDWRVSVAVPTEEGEKVIPFPPVKVFASADEVARAPEPEAPVGISFLKEQQWKILAGTAAVEKRELVEQLRQPATVAARPGSLAQVTPPIAGRLLLPSGQAMPLVGDRVEAGQLLALLQPAFSEVGARLVEAEGEVVRARLALEQAELAHQRTTQLAKAEARSGRELQESEFALKAAQARAAAAQALQATYRQASANQGNQTGGFSQPAIELRSPIAGVITSQSGAAVGEYITPEKAIFTVLDSTHLFIEAHVPEASVQRLSATKAASFEVPGESGLLHAITGEGGGRLVALGIQVNAATRTVPLVYEAKNSDLRLRVGQAVTLLVETSRAENTLAIPSAAIVEEDGRPIAFVQVGGETFQKRDLTLGIRAGGWVQVLSGLAEGERIVVKGAYAVRLASVSSAIPAHGHTH